MSAWLLEVFPLESVGVGPDVSSVVRGPYALVGCVGPDVRLVVRGLPLESVGVGPDVSVVVRGLYARVGRRWYRCQLGC